MGSRGLVVEMQTPSLYWLFPLSVLLFAAAKDVDSAFQPTPPNINTNDPTSQQRIQDKGFSTRGDRCSGGHISLRPGEATKLRSHTSYGRTRTLEGQRCSWKIVPEGCDLSLSCRINTRGIRSSRLDPCTKADHLQIMYGNRSSPEFNKLYCGTKSANIRFTGDSTLHIIFKRSGEPGLTAAFDGYNCKIICLRRKKQTALPSSPPPSPSFYPSSTSLPSSSSSSSSSSSTSQTSTPSSTTTFAGCECGTVQSLGRIICPPHLNCTVTPGSIPWQAALISANRPKPFCGGTLINSRFVMTAAHCVEHPSRQRAGAFYIVLGEHDVAKKGETFDLKYFSSNIVLHPRYKSDGFRMNFDFALIQLSKHVDFSKISWIRPACLPQRADLEFSLRGLSGTVSGWGLTDWHHKTQTTALQAVNVTLMDNLECLRYYSDRQLTGSMVCGAAAGADACNGDSGGPLTVQDDKGRSVLTGVVSWGIQCGNSRYPGVYARVSHVIDWIYANIRTGTFCQA